MYNKLKNYFEKPALYAPGTANFWDDEHISKGMLEAHLHPDWDAASRNHEFINKSVKWVSEIAPPNKYKHLLDLGCGPGLYAERFNNAGYSVVGIDFSKRSVEYAKEQAVFNKSIIKYHYQNYLTIDFIEQFDVATLIYCDYAPLSVDDRKVLLNKVFKALKPGGKLIFDVFTPAMRKAESQSWSICQDGGFFCEQSHVLFNAIYQYDDEDKTELNQHIVITEKNIQCYHIWDHFFTKDMLLGELQAAGFSECEFYGDVSGAQYSDDSQTICVVASRGAAL